MSTGLSFYLAQTLTHNGTVVVFGESKGEPEEPDGIDHKLWYKVLDLEQVADAESPSAWDDNTRWTEWMEVPYPDELRGVSMSMLTVDRKIADGMQTAPGRWQVLSDGSHIYLFRAIEIIDAEVPNHRVYANRYTLLRDTSPTGGTNRGASGQAITVPQLKLVYEARYRRSEVRETPQSDTDGQGYLDMRDNPFIEPTMDFSMVTPVNGYFTVTLAPSPIPGRQRWQFFWKAADKKLAALSLLRDEDGWVDLDDKSDAFNSPETPYRLKPDREFTLHHAQYGTLELAGRPDCIMFRAQEESTGLAGDREQIVSPERVLLAGRFMVEGQENLRLVVVDFDLDDNGIAAIGEDAVNINTVDFARTALHLDCETDQVAVPALEMTANLTFQAWVKHNKGKGTLAECHDPNTGQGFGIEWNTAHKKLIASLTLPPSTSPDAELTTVAVKAPMPTSHLWHHVALVVAEGGNAALYIDGSLAGKSETPVAGFSVNAPLIIGGSSTNGAEVNWLDFEIDQVVLWGDARPPTIDDIYYELSGTVLSDVALLGCWQMDDAHNGSAEIAHDSSSYERHATIRGADHVNQTAPIFRAGLVPFEDSLHGLSVGMGLVEFAKTKILDNTKVNAEIWVDTEVIDDPRLFLSSDGLIHLYTIAKVTKVKDITKPPDITEQPVVLQYDTASTRAQFRLTWTAISQSAGTETGELMLIARTPGPIMNRTTVTVEEDVNNTYRLVIHNEHTGLDEIWEQLPASAADIITILNGEASADPSDEAVKKGQNIYYDYVTLVDCNGQPLPGVIGEGNKPQAVPSPTFMAFGAVRPANGADPVLDSLQTVRLRQQGNFGGWAYAPVAVSGQFGRRGNNPPVAALVDLSKDSLMFLCCPGDFALEAWIHPDSFTVDQQIAGIAGEGRILNVKGWDGKANYTLGVRPKSWSLMLKETNGYAQMAAETTPPLLPSNVSFSVKVRLTPPANPNQVGSLFQLISEDCHHMFCAETDINGVWFRWVDRWGRVTLAIDVQTTKPDKVASEVWTEAKAAATLIGETGDSYRIRIDANKLIKGGTYTLALSGTASESRQYPFPADPEGSAAVEISVRSDNDYQEFAIDYHADDQKTYRQLTGSFPDPAAISKSIFAPFGMRRETPVDVTFVWDVSAKNKRMRLLVNDEELSFVEVSAVDYGEIRFINLGAPTYEATGKTYWGDRWEPINPWIRGKFLGPKFGQGCGLTVKDFKLWPFAISKEERRAPNVLWDLSPSAMQSAPKPESEMVVINNQGHLKPAWNLTFPKSNLETVYELFAAANNRQVISKAQIQPDGWTHVAAVCTNNHALQFDGQKQRTIIKDSGGLNAERAFTLDCAFRWDGGPGTQYLVSRSNESQSDMVFQLGIDSTNGLDGTLFLHCTIINASGGEEKIKIKKATHPIRHHVNYHIVAYCALNDVTYPEGRENWNQLWFLSMGLFVFNLDQGGLPDRPGTSISFDNQWLVNHRGSLNAQSITRLIATTSDIAHQEEFIIFISENRKANYNVALRRSKVATSIGSLSGEEQTADIEPTGWFYGQIGSLRFWAQRLECSLFSQLVKTTELPVGVPEPSAQWDFEENKGLVANDSAGGMAANVTDETMWTTSRLTSRLTLYVNGRPAGLAYRSEGTMDYGDADNRLTLGAIPHEGGFIRAFNGQLDDIRIWGDLRTQEEIYDNCHVLLGGNEDNLVGYWPIMTASGTTIKDATGHGNHASLNDPAASSEFWKRPTDRADQYPAPIGNELPQVRNLLGGPETYLTAVSGSSCCAAEYGETQINPEGQLKAVMKRCLVLLDHDGRCETFTGFKVGDLDLIYIGQAQSVPTLIGYIEGAPPVPSENATRAYYTSPTLYTAYDSSSSVKLVEAENTVQVYSAESNRGFDQTSQIALGGNWGGKYSAGVSWVAFSSTDVFDCLFEISGNLNIEHNYDHLSGSGVEIQTTRSLTNAIGTVGDWERGSKLVNEQVGRRYLYANVGYALVKSGVANVYSMKMRKTGALMGITLLPDPDIKEDYNIITFELEPTYTKQGTLDGKIGFKDDPDYQGGQGQGSYFKPKEVNNLIKQIEAYEASLAGNYDQFDAGAMGCRDKGRHFGEDDPAENATNVVEKNLEMPYDLKNKINKRNIVNTYVWTAEGGLFVEHQETSVVREESLGGAYGFKGLGGVSFKGKVKPGIIWDVKVLFGGHIQTKVMKTKKEGRDFGVDVALNVDGYLRKYTGNADMPYGADDVPGKVRAYRFKTFYLVPDKNHYQDFWDRVVSQKWLNGDSPNAQALRMARGNVNPVWRVMHRVTYVERIPPARGDEVASTSEIPTRAVIHIVPNRALINLVLDVIREGKTSLATDISGLDRQEQITLAVADVLDHQLGYSIPWWPGYLELAEAAPGGKIAEEVRLTKQAVYEYMLAYFESGAADQDPRLRPKPGALPIWNPPSVKPWPGGPAGSLVGRFPRAGIKLTITLKHSGWEGTITTTSGQKKEYGVGGFEVKLPLPPAGTNLEQIKCIFSFLDQAFEAQIGVRKPSFVEFSESVPGEVPAKGLTPMLGKWQKLAGLVGRPGRSSRK